MKLIDPLFVTSPRKKMLTIIDTPTDMTIDIWLDEETQLQILQIAKEINEIRNKREQYDNNSNTNNVSGERI